jgi:dTDP-4-amino-4,6-dideoxygalactose transaminase
MPEDCIGDILGYFINKGGFTTGIGTYACHLQPVFEGRSRTVGACSYAKDMAKNTISLPIYPGLDLLQKWGKKNG